MNASRGTTNMPRHATPAIAAHRAAAARSSRPRPDPGRRAPRAAEGERTRLRRAVPADRPLLTAFMRALYAHDGLAYRPAAARAALDGLMRSPVRGEVYIVECGGRPAGYAVLTFGWSLEYEGADAFIDEIFVDPSHRGRGLGRAAIEFLVRRCRARGVRALHLEV